ncbi:MAG: hypothetical protein ACI9WU_001537 [Myxococcota bacterium]|jgi:hypothetical protein
MSIAICFVARTGIVLGTDSRVTTTFGEGATWEDAYPKLVQFGDRPVALAMVGAGAFGGRDFRSLIAETWREHEGALPETIEDVARAYAQTAGRIARDAGATQRMDVLVAGYSPGNAFGELWEVILPAGEVTAQARPQSQTFVWRGQTDAVKTLWWGADLHALRQSLEKNEVPRETADAVIAELRERVAWGPTRTNWGMPLSSAVDIVRFQLDLQIQAERFLPGRGRCGAPTQIVAINDSGLTWIDQPFPEFSRVGSARG